MLQNKNDWMTKSHLCICQLVVEKRLLYFIHTPSNACSENNQFNDIYDIIAAEHAEEAKDRIYSKYEHDGLVIGFAMDSRGHMSPAAARFIHNCYKRSSNNNEPMRVTIQQSLLNSLSCLLAKQHRALDYIFMVSHAT